MLAHAVFHATENCDEEFQQTVQAAKQYIEDAGGVEAVVKRYGKDKTFSIPILTHCALAGLVSWKEISALPFELACLPPQFYKTVRLPVVSYALPALIAIGQVRHYFRKPWNPFLRLIRKWAIKPSLRRLESIQPENGGFLEAAPLTSFVTMSLAAMGLHTHPVARKGLQFLKDSVRPDGSWPIDTNLATWVTTLSVNALKDDVPESSCPNIFNWLIGQQYKVVHPYTNADPGGWAWTDLPGGVPDADDTPGAMLALMQLSSQLEQAGKFTAEQQSQTSEALVNAANWLMDLQNRDGGFPTFCRGWGTLPFDRSSADITAHCLRALFAWFVKRYSIEPVSGLKMGWTLPDRDSWRPYRAIQRGFEFLSKVQRTDGSWLPLWFGNQHGPDDENPTYGTARVLAAYRDCGRMDSESAQRGLQWLVKNQNEDGGWGGLLGIDSSVEETALATEILVSVSPESDSAQRGIAWILDRVDAGTFGETTPIGFYFAKLWYFERLYPFSFMVSALKRAVESDADNLESSSPIGIPQEAVTRNEQ
ncbi:MAG: prenyltransferase/squalene oxidase repeat-containing protein [Planctomycetaceae bacterium]